MDGCTRKMRLAVDVLLGEPDEISDGLEAELYALKDKLDAMELEQEAAQRPNTTEPLGGLGCSAR
jgi:hypothetical protein